MPFFALLLFLAADDPADVLSQELKKIVDIFVTVDEQAADPVSPDVVFYQGAIPNMLRTLDPHSIFFDAEQYQQLKEMESGESKGFGSIVSVLPGRVIVLQTVPGTPSAKAGLSAGDEILAINGIPLARLEMEQLVQVLSQSRQREAVLDVRHPGNTRLFRLTMTPELVNSPSVDRAFALAPGIGYVRITSFELATGKLLREAIEKLGGENLTSLVIDLRNNPGGVVQAAVETASLFLQPEQLIFSIKGRTAKSEEVRAPKLGRPYKFPLAVLIDGKSASASEIVTGALQDHDRATVLGEPSYGKGRASKYISTFRKQCGRADYRVLLHAQRRSIQKPLQGGTLDATTSAPQGSFSHRGWARGAGRRGYRTDEIVLQPPLSPLAIVLDGSGALTTFAGEYVQSHPVHRDFEATPAVLDELQVFLSARNIRPSIGEWLSQREWIESRVKQEVLNLAYGVAAGDEVEMQRDKVVQRAVQKLTGVGRR